MGIYSTVLVFFCIVFFFGTSTYGHSYVTTPITRSNQKQSTTGAFPGPCDVVTYGTPTAATPTSRGSTVAITWPRNNHPGGFIRWSWAQTSMSGITNLNTQAEFDANVDFYECFEKGGTTCSPASDPNGADSAATNADQEGCSTAYVIPSFLADGAWTLQWAWFGGGYTLPDYYSCIDFTISGGSTLTSAGTPSFVGGDYSYPGQAMCKFFNNNQLGHAPTEPCPGCNGSVLFGAPDVNYVLASTGSGTQATTVTTPCTSNSGCTSGVCLSSGFCMGTKASGLNAGGIAAIVFALLFAAAIVIIVIFVVINKTEVRNWKPFRK